MRGEHIRSKTIAVFIIALALLIILVQPTTAQPTQCTPAMGVCIDHSITETGFGAVEICNECFLCGLPDGICPEEYTDGQNETDENKTEVMMSQSRVDRPDTYDSFKFKMYESGNEACAAIGGTCIDVQDKRFYDETWKPSAENCGTDIDDMGSESQRYLKAICEGVPRTSGCQWCPDPDCQNTFEGVTYDNGTNESLGVNVNIVSKFNWRIRSTTTADATTGYYSLPGVQGNVEVVCTYEDYLPVVRSVHAKPGLNIVDCPMIEAYCTPECTLPDQTGEYVCKPKCHTRNGCYYEEAYEYPSGSGVFYNASKECEGSVTGGRRILKRIDDNTVFGVECCPGIFQEYNSQEFKIEDNPHIKNLLTRTYRKKLNGEPVEVKIIVYDKHNTAS